MYLINKFEKNILENSLNKMSSGNPNLNENSKPSNSISQETQTNDVVENISKDMKNPEEVPTKIISNEIDTANSPKQSNQIYLDGNEEDNTLAMRKNLNIKKRKKKFNVNDSYSNSKSSKGIKTRNMTKSLENLRSYPYRKKSTKNTKTPSSVFTSEKNDVENPEVLFHGWKF